MNDKNLKPIKSKRRARELGRKGGKVISIRKKLNRRVNCTSTCPLYPCIFEPLSRAQYKGKCALKQQSSGIITRFFNLVLKEEGQFLSEMRKALMRLSIKESDKDLIHYGEKVHKMLWGDKSRTEVSVDDSVVNIIDLIAAFKGGKK